MCERFTAETGICLTRKVDSPYITNEAWAADATVEDNPGVYTKVAPSYAASALFLYRVGRPDIAASTQRLCSKVTYWTTVHDKALIRLMCYAFSTREFVVTGSLSPVDLIDLQLHCYSDADLNGNPETSKSASGWWVELASKSSDRTFPLSWGVSGQTSTSCSTAESETVAFSHALRREALPIQSLLEDALGQPIEVLCLVDNTQCIQAVEKGYSKKFRHLPRTQRVCLGLLNEIITDPELHVSLKHCPTAVMKADIFTKSMPGPRFSETSLLIGMHARL